eukprot:CAMPEP_0182488960 /NCGR_PEP_ID=MMETSP1319-20130603/48667_1 /TAXON_ID=172717 /ORGANISM="Bolidomonas pacifica, Strain RCC208" /LENGTH=64 /DNA_ID=CAMNT_0024691085 /DNA_START=722 /DNA_END=916 /DNA_ORIENTATION=+
MTPLFPSPSWMHNSLSESQRIKPENASRRYIDSSLSQLPHLKVPEDTSTTPELAFIFPLALIVL